MLKVNDLDKQSLDLTVIGKESHRKKCHGKKVMGKKS